MKKFQVIIKIQNQYIIKHEHKPKKVQEWIDTYQSDKKAEEINIFELTGNSYTLVAHDHKRTIGFC